MDWFVEMRILPVQQTNVKKKKFSPTILIFDFNYKNEFYFQNEIEFHFGFSFQNQIHSEKVLAASENL